MRVKIYDISSNEPKFLCNSKIKDGYDLTKGIFNFSDISYPLFFSDDHAAIPNETILKESENKLLELRIWRRPKKDPDFIVSGTIKVRYIQKLDGGYKKFYFKVANGIDRAIRRIGYL